MPSISQLTRYYEEHYSTGRLHPMLEEGTMTRLRAERRLGEVMPHVAAGRWLDVGCSDGTFVGAARRAGQDAEGIEFASPAVAEAQKRGLPVSQGRIEDRASRAPYDSITAFDVLEHVTSPRSFLEHANRLLRPGGTLALSVPNEESMTRKLMGKHWYFFIPDGHPFTFGAKNLTALLERTGFELISLRPTAKPITFRYALSQISVLNPVLDLLMRPLMWILPGALKDLSVPLYLGELLAIAEKIGETPTSG